MGKVLTSDFYTRQPTTKVARGLLGAILCRRTAAGLWKGKIVETEAYLGEKDLACHSARGRTARTAVMFGPGGFAYVYLIYGMYACLNVVTQKAGEPEAVLIRALQPLIIQSERIHPGQEHFGGRKVAEILNGPGKLCREFGIDRSLNGIKLFRANGLWIEAGEEIAPRKIAKTRRIGVAYAGIWKDKPLRFYIQGNPFVSKK